MTPDIVVDVGNTAIKWGRCSAGRVTEICSLPPDSPDAWREQAATWKLRAPSAWVIAGVHPARRDRLAGWLRERGDSVLVIDDPGPLPLKVLLARPDYVGIDRLLDAVAANSRRTLGRAAVIVDAGSAVTVDWVDETGAFRGGAILPGLRLMAQALHDHTALLPLEPPPSAPPVLPGTDTRAAIRAGIYWAVAGGVAALVAEYGKLSQARPQVFLTGGDIPALLPAWGGEGQHWSEMTLEGIRLAAESLP
jgi:type III pantothenate kinase